MKSALSLVLLLSLAAFPAQADKLSNRSSSGGSSDSSPAEREPDSAEVTALRNKARGGDIKAMMELAEALRYELGSSLETKEAVAWYERAASKGNSDAAFEAGYMHDVGEGVAEDDVKAAKYYAMAPKDPYAIQNLALLYQSGSGVQKDPKRAIAMFEKAAGMGHVPSIYSLALAHDLGDTGLREDNAKAVKLYERAAKENYLSAIYNLALMHDVADGIPENNGKARELYLRTVLMGDSDSMYNLAVMYDNGEFGRDDAANAYLFYRLASQYGEDKASEDAREQRAKISARERSTKDAEYDRWVERISAWQAENN
jgi:uncharacterized protein